ALALREDGFETIMVNCNPETVSTDYDTSDKLYFEPLTLEDTLALIRREEPDGVVVQFGGQTPLRLAVPLERAGVPIIGTAPDSIDRAEDRERFEEVLAKLDLRRPPNGGSRSAASWSTSSAPACTRATAPARSRRTRSMPRCRRRSAARRWRSPASSAWSGS